MNDFVVGLKYALQRAKYRLKGSKFSRGREQKILDQLIAEVLPKNFPRTAVDIGAGNGIRWSNTYHLFLKGWRGVGIEGNPTAFRLLQRAYRNMPQVTACREFVVPGNAISLLKAHGIEKNFGVLSLDIDGNDYWVLNRILSAFRPGLAITEINEKIPPPLRFTVKFDPNFQLRHHFYGYSIAALQDLCERHDYGILNLEYNNAFIAPAELARERFISPQIAYEQGYLSRSDRKVRFFLNLDMEGLHGLSETQSLEFLRHFYTKEIGRYYLATDQESFDNLVGAEEL